MRQAINSITAPASDASPLPSAPSAPPTAARPDRRAFLAGFAAGALLGVIEVEVLAAAAVAIVFRLHGLAP